MMWQDNEQRARSIAGLVVIGFGVLWLLNEFLGAAFGEWLWIASFAGAAVVFGIAYRITNESWTLIVAYVMGAIATIIFLGGRLGGSEQLLPALVMFIIGTPFVAGWWFGRERMESSWGLLIPAYVMYAIGIGLLLIGPDAEGDWMAVYVLFVIGLPFVVAALWTRNWALLIPGGIMWVISLALLAGQIDVFAQLARIVVPLGLIIGGGWLLLRGGIGQSAPAKRKQHDE